MTPEQAPHRQQMVMEILLAFEGMDAAGQRRVMGEARRLLHEQAAQRVGLMEARP